MGNRQNCCTLERPCGEPRLNDSEPRKGEYQAWNGVEKEFNGIVISQKRDSIKSKKEIGGLEIVSEVTEQSVKDEKMEVDTKSATRASIDYFKKDSPRKSWKSKTRSSISSEISIHLTDQIDKTAPSIRDNQIPNYQLAKQIQVETEA